MRVEPNASGAWRVVDGSGAVLADSLSHAQAWRQMDVLNGEHLSRQEATSDWIVENIIKERA